MADLILRHPINPAKLQPEGLQVSFSGQGQSCTISSTVYEGEGV